ncbi:UNVERIFIED_CONTAM: hypothetical protein K2H54_000338 [Gekko kuhli]
MGESDPTYRYQLSSSAQEELSGLLAEGEDRGEDVGKVVGMDSDQNPTGPQELNPITWRIPETPQTSEVMGDRKMVPQITPRDIEAIRKLEEKAAAEAAEAGELTFDEQTDPDSERESSEDGGRRSRTSEMRWAHHMQQGDSSSEGPPQTATVPIPLPGPQHKQQGVLSNDAPGVPGPRHQMTLEEERHQETGLNAGLDQGLDLGATVEVQYTSFQTPSQPPIGCRDERGPPTPIPTPSELESIELEYLQSLTPPGLLDMGHQSIHGDKDEESPFQVKSYAQILKGQRDTLRGDVGSRTGEGIGTGFRVGVKQETREMPRRSLDYEKVRQEEDEFLQEFFDEQGEPEQDHDPRQRYVIRLRYKGTDIQKLSEDYVVGEFLLRQVGFPREEVLAVIMPPGSRETDICLPSERAYQKLWGMIREVLRKQPHLMDDYDLVPLFRGES